MLDNLLDLDAPATWPLPLLTYLEENNPLLLAWETGTGKICGRHYDAAICGLQDFLDGYSLVGWHCTRLTENEVAIISKDGIGLPDRAMLNRRLDALLRVGLLSEFIVGRLKETNQADDDNRASRIWFCFYSPRLAGEGGIGRFFRHWGGEALYNSHEDDPETGPVIARIGRPCLVEATVPISGMDSTRAAFNIARRYLIHRGLKIAEPVDLEGPARQPLPASAIRRIITFPGRDFTCLTGCDTWSNPLLILES